MNAADPAPDRGGDMLRCGHAMRRYLLPAFPPPHRIVAGTDFDTDTHGGQAQTTVLHSTLRSRTLRKFAGPGYPAVLREFPDNRVLPAKSREAALRIPPAHRALLGTASLLQWRPASVRRDRFSATQRR